MTTFEHAMVGVNGALAAGLDRRFGYQVVALAGMSAILPDWDSLTLLFGAAAFDLGHRVWGHNLLACAIAATLLAILDFRCSVSTRAARLLNRFTGQTLSPERLTYPDDVSRQRMMVWMLVANAAYLSHLPADMVVSGGTGLSDWPVELFWPFSNRGFVAAMVPWGDVGMTLVFIAGIFAMIKRPARRQLIANFTLAALVTYIVLRGTVFR